MRWVRSEKGGISLPVDCVSVCAVSSSFPVPHNGDEWYKMCCATGKMIGRGKRRMQPHSPPPLPLCCVSTYLPLVCDCVRVSELICLFVKVFISGKCFLSVFVCVCVCVCECMCVFVCVFPSKSMILHWPRLCGWCFVSNGWSDSCRQHKIWG